MQNAFNNIMGTGENAGKQHSWAWKFECYLKMIWIGYLYGVLLVFNSFPHDKL